MKRIIVLLVGLLFSLGAYAQALHFEQDSLAQVLVRARQANKPVFVLVAPPPPSPNLTKEQRKSWLASGLNDPEVVKQLNDRFLTYKAEFGKPEAWTLVRQYGVTSYPTYLYLNSDGTLLYQSRGNTRDPQRYLADIQRFEAKLKDPNNLSHYQQQYDAGKRDPDFLKQYITLRQETGVPIEQELLDAYVSELPVKAFDSFLFGGAFYL
jgi:hypothetical protein